MIAIKSMTLHSPFFLGGTNFQTKIDAGRKAGLTLWYDEENRRYLVSYEPTNGAGQKFGKMIHESAVQDSEPYDFEDLGMPKPTKAQLKKVEPANAVHHPMRKDIASAQVGDPTRGIK